MSLMHSVWGIQGEQIKYALRSVLTIKRIQSMQKKTSTTLVPRSAFSFDFENDKLCIEVLEVLN